MEDERTEADRTENLHDFIKALEICSSVLLYLSGGRDEQEGIAAIQRICEEDKEAKGITVNRFPAHTDTQMFWAPVGFF